MNTHPRQAPQAEETKARQPEAEQPATGVGVFVVDDHEGFRSLAAEVIAATDGFIIRGTASSWPEAQHQIGRLETLPDLVLMDVHLGEASGVAAAGEAGRTWPKIRVLLISTVDQTDLPPDAATAASGFLPKSRLSPTTLRQAWDGAFDWPSS